MSRQILPYRSLQQTGARFLLLNHDVDNRPIGVVKVLFATENNGDLRYHFPTPRETSWTATNGVTTNRRRRSPLRGGVV
jgi:hypothetical protein